LRGRWRAPYAEESNFASVQVTLPYGRAQGRVVAFESQIEVRCRESYLATRAYTRIATLVEQFEDSRLGAFADQAVAADCCGLVADEHTEGRLSSTRRF
jgi:hypothetical protein